MTLTREEIIKQEKATEESFLDKARALKRQSDDLLMQAQEFATCAQIAKRKYQELEKTERELPHDKNV